MSLEKVLSMYKEATEEHISELLMIIKDDIGILNTATDDMGRNLLALSAEKIMERWRTGKKYLRTLHAMKAIPGYPEDILKLSVSVDAIVNNLDDLLDESLSADAKSFYIVELIKLFSMFNYQNADAQTKNAIAKYFNKLISVALLEKFYYGMIIAEHNADEPLEHVLPLYDCRSLDIDIFMEIPMIRIFGDAEGVEDVIDAARCFRALNLLKKDITDFEHDKEQGQSTIITIFSRDKKHMKEIIESMVVHYLKKYSNLNGEGNFKHITDNYRKMADDEAAEIGEALNHLLSIC